MRRRWFGVGRLSGRRLRRESELRRLRFELEESAAALLRARSDLAREREQAEDRAEEAIHAEVSRLLDTIGTPAVQLETLAHLHGSGSAQPGTGDVLDVGIRLVRGLEDFGVRRCGAVGERQPFDPVRHDPLGATAVEPGQPVVIRFVGLDYRSRIVRKAGVEATTR